MAAQASPVNRCGQSQSFVFKTDTATLFVPSDDMRLVHQAGTPAAVIERANLPDRIWHKQWKPLAAGPFPWLLEWLYSWRMTVPTSAAHFAPSPAMLAFRKEATIAAIAAATAREGVVTTNRKLVNSFVSVPVLYVWMDRFAAHPWFEPWLLRGQELPADVTIATVDQARHCRAVWDFTGHCRAIGKMVHNTYSLWLEDRSILPDAAHLKWLYGAEPEGFFVVSEALQRLRAERTHAKIARAAGVDLGAIRDWTKHKDLASCLPLVLEAAAKGTAKGAAALFDREEFRNVHPRTAGNMAAYVKAASVSAALVRANVQQSTYYKALADAEQLGVLEPLETYLCPLLQDAGERFVTSVSRGVIAPKLFVPSEAMFAFRKQALAAGARFPTNHGRLLALPAIDPWRWDWTRPPAFRGKRKGAAATNVLPPSNITAAAVAHGLDGLNDTEAAIVEFVLANGDAHGEEIADALQRAYNSNFKATLSSMFKRGKLEKRQRGYSAPLVHKSRGK